MPTAYVQKMAKKHNLSIAETESLWNKAKDVASENNHAEDFDYITGVFKRMLGENSRLKLIEARLSR